MEPVSEPPAEKSPVALVVGAGDALGGAIARRFAREGYVAAVGRRSAEKLQPLVAAIEAAGGRALPFGADARREEEIVALFERIEREVGPIEVAVFNIGGNVRFGIVETTARVYAKVWEMACFAGFLTGREAAKVMLPRGRGTILFTGATASPHFSMRTRPDSITYIASPGSPSRRTTSPLANVRASVFASTR